MFVFSVKANKPKLIIILCVAAVVLVAVALILGLKDKPTVSDTSVSYKATNSGERIAFLSQFGWKINEDPVEVSEVIIPSEFDDTYESYNAIQKNQSLDLEPYKGVRAKKWVYEVRNYPNYAADSGFIMATLLVYDGIVIGGDVSSIEPDGFMQGFEYPDETLNATTAASQTSVTATPTTTVSTTQ